MPLKQLFKFCWLIPGCQQHLEDFEGWVNGGLCKGGTALWFNSKMEIRQGALTENGLEPGWHKIKRSLRVTKWEL